MPNTTMLAVIAGAAMAGVPLLNGFLSKEMFFAETLAARRGLLMDVLPVGLAIAASAFGVVRSEEHTSELQSLMRISYAVFCLKKKTKRTTKIRSGTTNGYR